MSSRPEPVLEAPHLNYHRNLVAVIAASFIGFMSFTIAMPFLPVYIRQLGVEDVAAIALWSGLCLGSTPAVTALLSPFWGRLADRYGKKIMVERSLVSFAVLMSLGAFVTDVRQLFAIRLVQGLFAGYGALAIAMAAESAPPGRMGPTIGAVQTAQRLGPAVGPVVGGVVAELVGLRKAFLVTGAMYGVALALVVTLYHEPRPARRAAHQAANRVSFRNVLAFQNFVLLMAAIFFLQFVDRSLGPILPLYLSLIGVPLARVALVAGIIFSAGAAMAALGHHLAGHFLRTHPPGSIITVGAAVAAVGGGLMAAVGQPWQLTLLASLFGVGVGAAMTAAYTAGGSVLPDGAQGTGFGLLTSASLIGTAASPLIAGFIGGFRLRAVFLLDAAMLAVLVLIVSRLMSTEYPAHHAAGVEEVP